MSVKTRRDTSQGHDVCSVDRIVVCACARAYITNQWNCMTLEQPTSPRDLRLGAGT